MNSKKIIFALVLLLIYMVFRKEIEYFNNSSCGNIKDNQNLIIKNLWVGNYKSALDETFLKRNNIKLIINLSKNLEFTSINNIQKLRIPINDDLSTESNIGMVDNFQKSYDLINKYLQNNLGVLIHCRAGAQRSATLAALFLMKRYNINSANAIVKVKSKRPIAFFIRPNFQSVLDYFDNKILKN